MKSLSQDIAAVVLELFDVKADIVLTRPDPQFGDFATNVALQLSKELGQNPRQIAESLQTSLQTKLSDQVSEVTIAGPGFINFRLSDNVLVSQLDLTYQADSKQTLVIETNNPNPFKAMHIGHAFNAVVADTIANLLQARGDHIHRVSYHGDVGLHVGKSMYSLLRFVDGDVKKLDTIEVDQRNSFMSKMYAEGSNAYKQDSDAKEQIDQLTKQSFTREDKLYAEVYETCKDWSFEQIDELVGRLGNKPVERRFLESDADARGVPIVRKNVPKIFQESDGALVFPGSKYGAFDNVFVTSRGLGLYGARDLGLMQLKNEYYHPDKSYIVTAEEQRDYFKGVIAAAGLCFPELKDSTVNISTGTVKLSTGKMSSRTGEVVEVSWLFDQVAQAIKTRGGDVSDIFVSAVLRYQFLKVRVGSDVVFDISEAVSLEGNNGPYLQYAHARARSILAKTDVSSQPLTDIEPGERSLVSKLTEYPGVVAKATDDLSPHIICTYLYELAQEFNRFYENNRVIGEPREPQRLFLISKYCDVLKNGLGLLGIEAPEKM